MSGGVRQRSGRGVGKCVCGEGEVRRGRRDGKGNTSALSRSQQPCFPSLRVPPPSHPPIKLHRCPNAHLLHCDQTYTPPSRHIPSPSDLPPHPPHLSSTITSITLPTATTAATSVTACRSSWLMCTRPSRPGPSSTKAPNIWMLVTLRALHQGQVCGGEGQQSRYCTRGPAP